MSGVQEHQSQTPLMFAMAFAQKPQVPHMLTPLPSLTLPSTHFLSHVTVPSCAMHVHVCSVGTQQLLKMAPPHFHTIQPSTPTVFSSLPRSTHPVFRPKRFCSHLFLWRLCGWHAVNRHFDRKPTKRRKRLRHLVFPGCLQP